jgi:hypothetical protein
MGSMIAGISVLAANHVRVLSVQTSMNVKAAGGGRKLLPRNVVCTRVMSLLVMLKKSDFTL